MSVMLALLIALAAPPAAPDHGYLSVAAVPWGSVQVDGERVATETPLVKYRLAPGTHEVALCPAADCSGDVRVQTVEIRPGKTTAVHFGPAAGGPSKAAPTAGATSEGDPHAAAVAHVARGERQAAVALLEGILAKDPDDKRAHQRLCAIYRPLGRLEDALAHCRRWRALEPNASYHPAIDRNIGSLEAEVRALKAAP